MTLGHSDSFNEKGNSVPVDAANEAFAALCEQEWNDGEGGCDSVVSTTSFAAVNNASTRAVLNAAFGSLTGLVSDTVAYLSYTRRWYTSLSSVGGAM